MATIDKTVNTFFSRSPHLDQRQRVEGGRDVQRRDPVRGVHGVGAAPPPEQLAGDVRPPLGHAAHKLRHHLVGAEGLRAADLAHVGGDGGGVAVAQGLEQEDVGVEADAAAGAGPASNQGGESKSNCQNIFSFFKMSVVNHHIFFLLFCFFRFF